MSEEIELYVGDEPRQPLTDKQEMFCLEYLVDLNGTQAAKRAGYSEHSAKQIATENLSKPSIRRRLDELFMERAEQTIVTADYVISTIVETVERCRQNAPVRGRDGKIVPGEWQFDSRAILKGAELLGRHLKLYTDKHEHGSDKNSPVEVKHTLAPAGVEAVHDAFDRDF